MLVTPFPAGRITAGTPTCPSMATITTAWGDGAVVWANHDYESGEGFQEKPADALLCRILTPGLTRAELRAAVLRRHPGCMEVLGDVHGHFHPEVVPEWFGELTRFLQGYYVAALRGWSPLQFAENWSFWKPRLDWSQVTPFQRHVLEIVAMIPSGMQLTYGQVAARLGKPGASRAVGAAIGSNPWPVLIPCHRVVGAKGKLTGFSAPGGIDAKGRMLALESSVD